MGDVNAIVSRRRETKAAFHFETAQAWRRFGEPTKNQAALVYAAFELRCTIERFVFELFVLLRTGDLRPDEAKKISSLKSLIQKVHEEAGGSKAHLRRILVFNRVYASEVIGHRGKLSVPDLGVLHKRWSQLSEYCHRQLIPAESWESEQWIDAGYQKLNEIESYLWEIGVRSDFGHVDKETIPHSLAEIREEFLQGDFDEAALQRRLRIAFAVATPKR